MNKYMKKKARQTYEKPKLGVFRAPVTLMENYSRKPGHFSRENNDYDKTGDNYDKDSMWD